MSRKRWDRIACSLVVVALLAYGALLVNRRATAVGGSDSSGYASTARLMLSGRIVQPIRGLDQLELPDQFGTVLTPLAFLPGPRPRTEVPLYPPGFPVHIALTSLLAGSISPYIVSPLAAVLCLLLTYLLGRELGLSRPFACAGAAILGACPVFLFQATQTMSDIVATVWAVAAILFGLRSRRRDGWALAAGAALGIAVMVRPVNALVVFPLALAIPWRWKTIALLVAGGLPLAAFLLAWNHAAYGGYFQTGYSWLLGNLLAARNFPPRFWHYAYWVTVQLSPLVPIGWMAVVADRRLPGRDRAMLVVWFAAFFAFYCFWDAYEVWWYTRFLLPALPALIVGFLLVVQDAIGLLRGRAARGPIRGGIALALLLIVGAAELRISSRFSPLQLNGFVFSEVCQALAAKVPDGKALVLSKEFSGALRFHTNLTPVRWDKITPAEFIELRAKAAEKGYRIFASLLGYEIDLARPHIPGLWVPIGRIRGAVMWELKGPRITATACSSLIVPGPETCNGIDDDCNGAIDDIPRTSYTDQIDRNVPLAVLNAKDAGCSALDDSTWLRCNTAIYLHCSDLPCRTAGVGPLEWGPHGATIACMTTEEPRDVEADDLTQFGTCPVDASSTLGDRFECAKAIHGYCTSRGYASGLGPVASPRPTTWSLICLRTGHATALVTTYRALHAFHALCTGRNTLKTNPTFCTTAAKRYCVDKGHVAGFGPVADPDGNSPTIVCLDE
jgi:hypothetical protein